MKFTTKLPKKNKYSKYISNIRNNTIEINVFDPDKITDLELVNKEKSNYKFKITKIACIVLLVMATPLMSFASEINSQNIISLTNKDRTNSNLNVVVQNNDLTEAATNKANDMLTKGYFEHFTPDGKTPWNFIKNSGYEYKYAGENLAMDFITAEGIETAWMNSGSHRKNILNAHYDEIGIGTATGNFEGRQTTIVVQMFGSQKETTSNSFIAKVKSLLGINL